MTNRIANISLRKAALVAGFGYLIIFILGSFAKTAFIVFVAVPAVIAEFSLTIWLLFKGAKIPEMKS